MIAALLLAAVTVLAVAILRLRRPAPDPLAIAHDIHSRQVGRDIAEMVDAMRAARADRRDRRADVRDLAGGAR